MIPQTAITHWRSQAPWPQDAQVEQDLILSRALVELYQEPVLSAGLWLRGGTALHKLYSAEPLRYSEDIDLVQAVAGPIGPLLTIIRARLDPVVGKPRRENNPDNVTLRYRMESEIPPVVPLRLKIEINTREHFAVNGMAQIPYGVHSPWFTGQATVQTYVIEELLATKLRALYQRRKGRDLFDLWLALTTMTLDYEKIVHTFRRYIDFSGTTITRAAFERNLVDKIASSRFNTDMQPLLAPDARYDAAVAAKLVRERLLSLL